MDIRYEYFQCFGCARFIQLIDWRAGRHTIHHQHMNLGQVDSYYPRDYILKRAEQGDIKVKVI